MKGKNLVALTIVAAAVMIGGLVLMSTQTGKNVAGIEALAAEKFTVYKSLTCGCCGAYVSYMKSAGLDVDVVNTEELGEIKERYGIPNHLESCHTTIFGDYVVEGHIPIEGIVKLVEEGGDIKGIAMPGMPAGSPGMGGSKQNPFTIYSLDENNEHPVFTNL